MTAIRSFVRPLALLAALVALTACGDPVAPGAVDSSGAKVGAPAFAQLVGEPVIAAVGSAVNITVRITDAKSIAVPSQLVNFVVVSGGGSVFAGSTQTSGTGDAKEVWTLGTVAGEQVLEARAVDQTTGAPIVLGRVSARATPGPAMAIQRASDGVIFMGERRAVADIFGVVDRYGNPVPVDASTIGLKDPWRVAGDTIIAPDSVTATGTVSIPVNGHTMTIRLFSAPDFRVGVFAITGVCPGVIADSVTFAATIGNVAYSGDRRTMSFVAPYLATKWSNGVGAAGVATFYSAAATITPDSVQTKSSFGTFVLTSAVPVIYASKATTSVVVDCKTPPAMTLVKR